VLFETPSPRGDTFFYFVGFIKPLPQCPLAVHLPYIRKAYHSPPPPPGGGGRGGRFFFFFWGGGGGGGDPISPYI